MITFVSTIFNVGCLIIDLIEQDKKLFDYRIMNVLIMLERWQETALLFFSALAFSVGKKINVLFVRWLF
jgi:hypothetical protein